MERKWTRREFSKMAALQLGVASLPAAGGKATAAAPSQDPSPTHAPIESAYSPRDGQWHIDWPGRLSQHDIVYLSPPEDPTLGLPIGNGDIGALLWTTERQLVFAINKCDTWDDAKREPFRNWATQEEEKYTTLRHCGRLVVDLDCPALDLLYQQDFQGRLDLASGIASLKSTSPFAKVSASTYVSAEHRVMVLEFDLDGTEAYSPRVNLERWGSRTFGHWYSLVNRDATVGLGGTRTSIEHNRVLVHQELRTLSFVMAAEVVAEGDAGTPKVFHSRAGSVEFSPRKQCHFTVYLTVVTSENDPDPVAAAHRILDRAVSQGETAIREKHRAEWKEFWSRSMIDLPEKYLENYWHLNLYFANSSSRGASPPLFCNGLWGWNRDFVPWIYYFHWNEQWSVWPLHAANHSQLATPYFRYRRAQLPHAMEYAKERMNKPGAFYADVADRNGYNTRGLNDNHTPGAQIALDFWRYFQYTGDDAFLRESAWPVIREVTRFNAACLIAGKDGLYHIVKTSAYEGSPLFDDTITDLAMIRALLPVSIRVGKLLGHDAVEVAQWQKLLGNLAPFQLVELEPSEFEVKGNERVHRAGLAPGRKLASRKVFAVGRSEKGEWIRDRIAGSKEAPYYGLPDPELAPVVPGDLIGLSQQGTDLFNAAVTQVRLHPSATPQSDGVCEPADMAGGGNLCMGWCPYPIALARLGLSEELEAELTNEISTWQFYPQGFGHYGPYPVFKKDQELRWHQNMPSSTAKSSSGKQVKFPFPTWPFRHFDHETMPILCSAMNEMLLQSHEGVIRIFPSVPKEWDVRFDLAAIGGFRVCAERVGGSIRWLAIESHSGGVCRVVNPWPSKSTRFCFDVHPEGTTRVGLAEEVTGSEKALRWETVAGRRYLLAPDETILNNWKVATVTPQARDVPRTLRQAKLGRERFF